MTKTQKVRLWSIVAMLVGISGLVCITRNQHNINEINQKTEYVVSGVTFHGYDCSGWIQNNNNSPVSIKKRNLYRLLGRRKTEWITKLEPGEKKETYLSSISTFSIFDMNDVLIGYIDLSVESPAK
ncbi:hypothetical protein HQ571_04165 [Candidatus Kuenenbacteria bacterium]|nr:hypothetical protein [Candidatus Kuenenbacteria bacterium]